MYILNLPEGRRLTRFKPPFVVARKRKRNEKISTGPQMEKQEVDHETTQSATMDTDYQVEHH